MVEGCRREARGRFWISTTTTVTVPRRSFFDRSDVVFASIHGDPQFEYPFYAGHADEVGEGEGHGFNLNLPLPAGTAYAEWSETLSRAIECVGRCEPDYLMCCRLGWTLSLTIRSLRSVCRPRITSAVACADRSHRAADGVCIRGGVCCFSVRRECCGAP